MAGSWEELRKWALPFKFNGDNMKNKPYVILMWEKIELLRKNWTDLGLCCHVDHTPESALLYKKILLYKRLKRKQR